MTKLIISLFFLLIFLTDASGQVDNVTGQYVDKGNILLSPGAESGVKGWTNSAGTFTVESTGAIVGQRVFKVVLSSQTLNLRQDSTKYATEYADGVQLIASVKVKTSVSGVKLCARKAGVVQTNLCMSHSSSGKWEHLKVPFISSATSNGLVILTDSAKTGTVYVDDAFVGAVDLSATQSFDTTCDTRQCATEFSFTVSSTGTVTNESMDFINGSCVFTTGFNCSFNSGLFTVAPNCAVAGDGANIAFLSTSASSIIVQHATRTDGGSVNVQAGARLVCQKQGADYTAALQAQKDYQKSKVSSYSSTNADTDWQACTFSTLAWQGLGTVTSDLKCKRQGSDLLINGQLTMGTTSASEARMLLPTWNGVQLIVKGSSAQAAGRMLRSNTTLNSVKDYAVMSFGGNNYLTISYPEYAAGFNPITPQVGNQLFTTGASAQVENIRIPIEGWENSNIIIGQFNGLEKCESTLDCTDTFSAAISSAGVVASGSENVDFIDGNCTNPSAGDYTCTFKTGIFTAIPNVGVSMSDGAGSCREIRTVAISSTSFQVQTFSSAGTLTSCRFNVVVQKQGADYTGKTALAVASSQNLRGIGVENVVVYSGLISSSFGSTIPCSSGTCFISGDAKGSATATFVSTGKYSLNFPADSFDANTIVSCSFNCHQILTTNAIFDSNLPVLTQADGSISLNSIGCGTLSSTPARTNSAVSFICTGIKK